MKTDQKLNIDAIICYSLFIVFFLGELLSKLELVFEFRNTLKISYYSKIFFLLYIITKIILSKEKLFKAIILLSCCFTIPIVVYNEISIFQFFKEEIRESNIYYFIRYMYLPLFVLFLDKMEVNKVEKFIDSLIIIILILLSANSLLIIIGLIYDLNIFKSYPNTERFGYNGFFLKPNDASYMYMLSTFYFFIRGFIYNEKTYKNAFLVSIFVSLLLGTKSTILFNTFLLTIFCFFISKYKRILRWGILLLIGLIIYRINSIINYFVEIFPFWKNIREEGIITLLSSRRNELIVKGWNIVLEKWQVLNYFFGGGNVKTFNAHSEVFDVFLVMGITGIVFFIWFIKNKIFIKKRFLLNITIGSILLMTILSGNLLFSIVPSLFLGIIIKRIKIFEERI